MYTQYIIYMGVYAHTFAPRYAGVEIPGKAGPSLDGNSGICWWPLCVELSSRGRSIHPLVKVNLLFIEG